jgi:hypothetical protein
VGEVKGKGVVFIDPAYTETGGFELVSLSHPFSSHKISNEHGMSIKKLT